MVEWAFALGFDTQQVFSSYYVAAGMSLAETQQL